MQCDADVVSDLSSSINDSDADVLSDLNSSINDSPTRTVKEIVDSPLNTKSQQVGLLGTLARLDRFFDATRR